LQEGFCCMEFVRYGEPYFLYRIKKVEQNGSVNTVAASVKGKANFCAVRMCNDNITRRK